MKGVNGIIGFIPLFLATSIMNFLQRKALLLTRFTSRATSNTIIITTRCIILMTTMIAYIFILMGFNVGVEGINRVPMTLETFKYARTQMITYSYMFIGKALIFTLLPVVFIAKAAFIFIMRITGGFKFISQKKYNSIGEGQPVDYVDIYAKLIEVWYMAVVISIIQGLIYPGILIFVVVMKYAQKFNLTFYAIEKEKIGGDIVSGLFRILTKSIFLYNIVRL